MNSTSERGVRLLAAQACQPAFFASQCAAQWLHLADAAACFAQVNALVHGFVAVCADEFCGGFGNRTIGFNRACVARFNAANHRHRLWVQHTGFQYKNAAIDVVLSQQVRDDHVFGT
jgi:hypothetical protein